MMRKVRDAAHVDALSQVEADTAKTLKGLYDFGGDILDVSSEVPPETDPYFGVHAPHKLSQPVQFLKDGKTVFLRLRELIDRGQRIGVRIEEADDAKTPKERTLFKLYPHMIIDWNGDNLTSKNTPSTNVQIKDVKIIMGIMVNHFNTLVQPHTK